MANIDELSLARRLGIMGALVGAQLVQLIPLGAGLNASLAITEQIGGDLEKASWIAASYSLTQGAFVLIGGRLGDVYGHKNTLLLGAVWWIVWSLVTGFGPSVLTISLFRGLTGIGGAFITPNAVALLIHTFPPGRLRNISIGLFGAMAPIGAAGGSLIAALLVQLTSFKWLFFFLAIFGTVMFSALAILVPGTPPSDKGGAVDWVGAYFGVTGLILFNFVWNQAPTVGWQEPYEYTLLIVSILHFCAFIYWEAKVAKSPILRFDIWTAPSFIPLVITVFISLMSFGIYIWYCCIWLLNVRGETLISTAASVVPLTVGGVIAAFVAAWLIPRIAAQYILAIGAMAMLIASTLVATMPEQQIYWQTLFPAMAIVSFCPDFIFTASQIIASNSVRRTEQGVAGSLIGTLVTYGISTGIGFGGTMEVYTNRGGADVVRGYRSALYLAISFAALALVLSLLFVRIKKDVREGWDEKDQIAMTQGVSSGEATPSTIEAGSGDVKPPALEADSRPFETSR